MPRPVRVSPLRSGRGEGRGSHFGALGRGLDDGDVARRLQIAQAEGDRVGAHRGGDLVDERSAGELDLRRPQPMSGRSDVDQWQPPPDVVQDEQFRPRGQGTTA
mgnify:CR=1 FL=1